MDYDQVARFLSSCTTPGFRRSLSASPHDALARCGFHPGESALLAASLAKLKSRATLATNEVTKVSLSFQKISVNFVDGKKSWSDDWDAP
jgi:hypothetical protein